LIIVADEADAFFAVTEDGNAEAGHLDVDAVGAVNAEAPAHERSWHGHGHDSSHVGLFLLNVSDVFGAYGGTSRVVIVGLDAQAAVENRGQGDGQQG
jgi:hypothetical protein